MRIWFFVLVICGVALSAAAQNKLFAVSGQGRGNSPADAKQAAQIGKLESENVDRKAETTQNAGDIHALGGRLSDVEKTCAQGEVLHWNGTSWSCNQESDPTVGPHAKTAAPPDCHDENAKLLWNTSSNQWECKLDSVGLSAENDPSVGSIVNGRWCRGSSGIVKCDQTAPSSSNPNFSGGRGPYCIMARSCPTGYRNRGTMGIITSHGKCVFNNGAPYNPWWMWCHPKLCCR